MRKALTYWYIFIISLLLITSLAVVSCGKKPTTTEIKETKSTNNTEAKYVFKSQTFKSLEIKDALAFSFPKIYTGATKVEDCDSLCNEKIKEALSKVNTSKTSGDNSYKFYYDALNDQLVLNVELGETVTQLNDSIKIKNQLIEKLENNVRIEPKPYVPTIIKYLAFFGGFCAAFIATFLIIKLTLFFRSKIPV